MNEEIKKYSLEEKFKVGLQDLSAIIKRPIDELSLDEPVSKYFPEEEAGSEGQKADEKSGQDGAEMPEVLSGLPLQFEFLVGLELKLLSGAFCVQPHFFTEENLTLRQFLTEVDRLENQEPTTEGAFESVKQVFKDSVQPVKETTQKAEEGNKDAAGTAGDEDPALAAA